MRASWRDCFMIEKEQLEKNPIRPGSYALVVRPPPVTGTWQFESQSKPILDSPFFLQRRRDSRGCCFVEPPALHDPFNSLSFSSLKTAREPPGYSGISSS